MECPYKKLGRIGQGAFYSVYRVADKDNNEVAIKPTHNAAELDTLTRIHHPNIIHAIDIIYDQEQACDFLTEDLAYTMPLGTSDLADYLRANPDEATNALYQVLLAFRFLSKQCINHNDFNFENVILIDGRFTLIDFQMCVKYYDRQETQEYRDVTKNFRKLMNVDNKYLDILDNDGIDAFLASGLFEGIYEPSDLEFGSVTIPVLPFTDNNDESIGRQIHNIIRGCNVAAYCLVFDLCYRFLVATRKLDDVDVKAINLIVHDFYRNGYWVDAYNPPKVRYNLAQYLKVFDYILYRPNIYTYAKSKKALLEMGGLLKTLYQYTRADLKVLADQINYKYKSKDYVVEPSFTDSWFP